MVVLLRGTTTCSLCGEVIADHDAAHVFPPIFMNQRSPVYVLNDGAVHDDCLAKEPFRDAALWKLETVESRRGAPKQCCVCEGRITDPDDYFATGPLADEPGEPIAAADWVEAHETCLPRCPRREELAQLLRDVSRSPDWEGDVLERLLDRLL